MFNLVPLPGCPIRGQDVTYRHTDTALYIGCNFYLIKWNVKPYTLNVVYLKVNLLVKSLLTVHLTIPPFLSRAPVTALCQMKDIPITI